MRSSAGTLRYRSQQDGRFARDPPALLDAGPTRPEHLPLPREQRLVDGIEHDLLAEIDDEETILGSEQTKTEARLAEHRAIDALDRLAERDELAMQRDDARVLRGVIEPACLERRRVVRTRRVRH